MSFDEHSKGISWVLRLRWRPEDVIRAQRGEISSIKHEISPCGRNDGHGNTHQNHEASHALQTVGRASCQWGYQSSQWGYQSSQWGYQSSQWGCHHAKSCHHAKGCHLKRSERSLCHLERRERSLCHLERRERSPLSSRTQREIPSVISNAERDPLCHLERRERSLFYHMYTEILPLVQTRRHSFCKKLERQEKCYLNRCRSNVRQLAFFSLN
jgi:hypothetical protein